MITDFRINAKGELEGKVILPAKWEEMYTKEEVIAMLTELKLEIEEIVKEEELIDKMWATGLHYSEKIIQQKINFLKEN